MRTEIGQKLRDNFFKSIMAKRTKVDQLLSIKKSVSLLRIIMACPVAGSSVVRLKAIAKISI